MTRPRPSRFGRLRRRLRMGLRGEPLGTQTHRDQRQSVQFSVRCEVLVGLKALERLDRLRTPCAARLTLEVTFGCQRLLNLLISILGGRLLIRSPGFGGFILRRLFESRGLRGFVLGRLVRGSGNFVGLSFGNFLRSRGRGHGKQAGKQNEASYHQGLFYPIGEPRRSPKKSPGDMLFWVFPF